MFFDLVYVMFSKLIMSASSSCLHFRCHEALVKNSALIGEEQYEYQKELERKFKDFQHQLAPMVSIQKKTSHGKKAR